LRLLRLRCLPVRLIIWPVGLPCLTIPRFTSFYLGDFRRLRYRGRGVPRSLQSVRRCDAIDDRRLVVSRNVRYDLLAAPGRAPISVVRELKDEIERRIEEQRVFSDKSREYKLVN